MRPKPILTPAAGETDMFRNRLDNMIDMRHELARLAGLIDWTRFDDAFGALYAEKGRPGLPTRLMVGLHLLKHARGVSDDQVCGQWVERTRYCLRSGASRPGSRIDVFDRAPLHHNDSRPTPAIAPGSIRTGHHRRAIKAIHPRAFRRAPGAGCPRRPLRRLSEQREQCDGYGRFAPLTGIYPKISAEMIALRLHVRYDFSAIGQEMASPRRA